MTFEAGDRLPGMLAQQPGEPLDPEKVRASTRRLFASAAIATSKCLRARWLTE